MSSILTLTKTCQSHQELGAEVMGNSISSRKAGFNISSNKPFSSSFLLCVDHCIEVQVFNMSRVDFSASPKRLCGSRAASSAVKHSPKLELGACLVALPEGAGVQGSHLEALSWLVSLSLFLWGQSCEFFYSGAVGT